MVGRFRLISLFWIAALVAISLSWFIHQRRLKSEISQLNTEVVRLNWRASAMYGAWHERRKTIEEFSTRATTEDAPSLIFGLHDPDIEVARTAHRTLIRISNHGNEQAQFGKSVVGRLKTIAYWCNWYVEESKNASLPKPLGDPFGDSVYSEALVPEDRLQGDPFAESPGVVGSGPVRAGK